MNLVSQTCASCGFENPRAFKACAACGAPLGASARATGRAATPGHSVEATIVSAAPLSPSVQRVISGADVTGPQRAMDEVDLGEELTSDELAIDVGGTRVPSQPAPPPDDVEPPIVGQEEASSAIRSGIDGAFSSGKPTLVVLEGGEGSGRSRLLFHAAELAARMYPSVRILYGISRNGDGANAPFSRLLLERFGVTPSSSPAAVRGLIATMVAEAIQSSDAIQIGETSHLLGHFAGIPFPDSPFLMGMEDRPEELKRRELAALKRLFTGDAQQRPTLVLIDNLHLAEDDAWAILEALLGCEAGIAFVCAGSPPVGERANNLTVPGGIAVGPIAPLGESDVASMLQILLPALSIAPEPVVAALTHRSRGNPGALRELVFALVEAGLFKKTPDGIVTDVNKLESGALPVTIEDAIRARLGRLDDLERATVDRAAVVGEVAWDRAVLAMMRSERNAPSESADPSTLWPDDDDESALAGALERLIDKGFFERVEDPDVPNVTTYRFLHGQSRDFVYRQIPEDVRRRRHQTVVDWFTNAVDVPSESIASLAAPHLEKAGHLARAGRAHLEAARHEHAKMHTQSALRSVEKALELLTSEELSRRVEALHIHGSVLTTLGRYDEAIAAFSEMLRVSWRCGARGKGGAALNRIARVHTMRGNLEAARGPLIRALQLFRAAGDLRGVASSLDDLAQLERLRGDLDAALDASSEALEIRRQAGDARGEAVSLSTVGLIQHSRGNLDAAEDAFRAALKLRESIGDRAGTMQSLNHMGIILYERGDRDASEAAWRACLQEARKMADRRMQGFVLNNLGESLALANKPAEARALLLEAQGVARELADKRVLAEVERNLGLMALALDDDEAPAILGRALVLAQDYGGKEAIARAQHAVARGRARTLFDATGSADRRAEESFLVAVDLYRDLGNEPEAARVMAELGRHLVERGDVEGAKDRLREARAIMRKHNLSDLDKVEQTLADLG
ncbi:MAG: tetratricopeptide repeat protein [Deltaproteobacteria bacterium]|nr:tetratricopeptide repeat protein [Deltaproteobacteria bacterium]